MIIGLGSDIVNIDRIATLLEKSGEKFQEKYFTATEITAAKKYSRNNKTAIAAHFAKRFAAKEAFAKAVGTGLGKKLSFSDIGVENDKSGKPLLVLNKKAEKLVKEISGNKKTTTHISLSDDYPYALAVVVVEGI